ncbi:MAG TPA: RidA family protein [Aestuariivirgaceae bacterium]|nr:RidA family protein [Aestuariivirgaceae bacterium]
MAEPSDIRRLAFPSLQTADGPFTHLVLDGTYAFVSGVVASDVPGGAAALGDIAQETEVVMTAIREGLAHIGLGMERILRVDVHITDIGHMAELDRAYARYFSTGAFPARTCTQSGGLAGKSNVEITVLARL